VPPTLAMPLGLPVSGIFERVQGNPMNDEDSTHVEKFLELDPPAKKDLVIVVMLF